MCLQRHMCTCVCIAMSPEESVEPQSRSYRLCWGQVLCKSSNRFLPLSSIHSPISPCLGLTRKPVKLVASQHIAKAAFAPPGGSECPRRRWHVAGISCFVVVVVVAAAMGVMLVMVLVGLWRPKAGLELLMLLLPLPRCRESTVAS